MAVLQQCKNDLIIDLDEGTIINERQAYLTQPRNTITTTDPVVNTGEVFAPTEACLSPDPPPPPPPDPPCNESECPDGLEVAYYNNISNIFSIGINTNQLNVNLAAADLITDQPFTGYLLEWGDGSPVSVITIGGDNALDVSLMPDGDYSGNISYEDLNGSSRSSFFYTVTAGVITSMTDARNVSHTFSLACNLYPNYGLVVTDYAEASDPYITNSEMKLFGVVVNAVAYAPNVNFYSETANLTNDFTVKTGEIRCTAGTTKGDCLQLASFKLQCVLL